MAIIERPAPTAPILLRAPVTPSQSMGIVRRPVTSTGWKSWVFTVDHKKSASCMESLRCSFSSSVALKRY